MARKLYLQNEIDRVNVLTDYGLMDSGKDPDFDAIAEIASGICGIPIALITFIDESRQYFKSHIGTDFTENLRESSFCTYAIDSTEEIMIVEDARKDSRFANNPLVTGPTKVVFYAGVPLVNEQGYALGTICVLDQKTHTLSSAQIQALKSLAEQIVDKIELKRKVTSLELANEELLNANVLIQKFASMAAHDIKNPLSSILLTTELLRKSALTNNDARALRLTEVNISSTKSLISLVEEMLEYSRAPELLFARKQKINVASLFERIKTLTVIPDNFVINFQSIPAEIYFSLIAIEQILLNLLSNAIRYNEKQQGIVQVELSEDSAYYVLSVTDNGNGIAEENFEKIFETNFTLHSNDQFGAKSNGIGLSTVKNLVTTLKGTITVESVLSRGSTFLVQLPK
jgi:signal transduction histidine kinase